MSKKVSKSEKTEREVAKVVQGGKAHDSETVDFSDPERPATCLELDFPIIPVNEIAAIEGNAMKPVYQHGKWWAWRRSAIFRSLLLSASTKAPNDVNEASEIIWDSYYKNHQKKKSFRDVTVLDLFAGGGTTLVEASRLGMKAIGVDLNPISWFITKQRVTPVNLDEVNDVLEDIVRVVKPQIHPFYTCDCPNGHRGVWIEVETGKTMDFGFNPAFVDPEERSKYKYDGPEIIYVFWSKHGICQTRGCGYRTPIFSSLTFATKKISVKYWEYQCNSCGGRYDVEEKQCRMSPNSLFIIADSEDSFCVLAQDQSVTCPHCDVKSQFEKFKPKKKSVNLSLLIHPDWLQGESGISEDGKEYGGRAGDELDGTLVWIEKRAKNCKFIEVRGDQPDEIQCPDTGRIFPISKGSGTVPKKGHFSCGSCGTVQDIPSSNKASGGMGPIAPYALQVYCKACSDNKDAYGGRFFVPANEVSLILESYKEWDQRKDNDLAEFWPKSKIPFGFMTALNNGDIRVGHGFTHWWKMFNPRQLLNHAIMLQYFKNKGVSNKAVEFVLSAFQQYLRNQNLFCFWHRARDHFAPALSNSNYHPKDTCIEVGAFSSVGYGPWPSSARNVPAVAKWQGEPWELAANSRLTNLDPKLMEVVSGKSEKIKTGDPVSAGVQVSCGTATDLDSITNESIDLVVTDPPFGGLLHYSELSDFFYVWLRLILKDEYPDIFTTEFSPKALEAVANRARQPENPDAFYQSVLTNCWKEAHRVLKKGGILTFTFHHSDDAPWVAVLESLFDAGFYLEATYPIRCDETKGEGSKPGTFGSQKIEYDIVHVCRKRKEDSKAISWAKMRRAVIQDIRRIKDLLEHHHEKGLPEADLQVIRRGKALEYFSKHYGKVFKDDDQPISVLEALVGINLLLNEELEGVNDPPPHEAEPFTRMFLRLFDGKSELPRDQMQKFLRGTGTSAAGFVERGWCTQRDKIFYLTSSLEIAEKWHGKHRKSMNSDYDQAMFLIGACNPGSGISANDTLENPNFKPHPALEAILIWQKTHGGCQATREAAVTAAYLYKMWEANNKSPKMEERMLFFAEEESS